MNKYNFWDILNIWEKWENSKDEYIKKWYSSWLEWRIDIMKKSWIKFDFWYKKEIETRDVLHFRVWAFNKILEYYKKYLNWNWNNYLKIKETQINYYEEIYTRNKEKIDDIINNMPEEINFIWWERKWNIILTEWHHRAIAISRALKRWMNLGDIKLNLYYHPLDDKWLIKSIDYIDLQ